MLYTMDQYIIYILPFGITSYTSKEEAIGMVWQEFPVMYLDTKATLFLTSVQNSIWSSLHAESGYQMNSHFLKGITTLYLNAIL